MYLDEQAWTQFHLYLAEQGFLGELHPMMLEAYRLSEEADLRRLLDEYRPYPGFRLILDRLLALGARHFSGRTVFLDDHCMRGSLHFGHRHDRSRPNRVKGLTVYIQRQLHRADRVDLRILFRRQDDSFRERCLTFQRKSG